MEQQWNVGQRVRLSPLLRDSHTQRQLYAGMEGHIKRVLWGGWLLVSVDGDLADLLVHPRYVTLVPEQITEDPTTDAMERMAESLAKITGQFEAVMAVLAQMADVLGPVVARTVELLEKLVEEQEAEQPEEMTCDSLSPTGNHVCAKPIGHKWACGDGAAEWLHPLTEPEEETTCGSLHPGGSRVCAKPTGHEGTCGDGVDRWLNRSAEKLGLLEACGHQLPGKHDIHCTLRADHESYHRFATVTWGR